MRIDAFLCPAHVSAIIGAAAYRPFTGTGGVPCVIAGFEPLDILLGVRGILEQLSGNRAEVDNQYSRVVKAEGNSKAKAIIDEYLEPVDASWRGLGVIPASGLALKAQHRARDAADRHGIVVGPGTDHPGCRCGDVVKGKCTPPECPAYANGCTPDRPLGPCMVSAEGTCAAYFKYSSLDS